MLPRIWWPAHAVLLIFCLFGLLKVDANPCLTAVTCTECVKASKDCGWCTDPQYMGSIRCDLKTNLESKCGLQHIYEPKTELRIPKQNFPLGKKQNDGHTITQLEPQQVQAKIKPGDSIEIPFHYEHRKNPGIDVRDFKIMTSSYKNTGVDVDFSIDCNGERKSGTLCPSIQDGDRIDFYIKLTLIECKSVALSISVYGYNTVSAVFVSPQCECECENPRFYERRSPICRHQGDLSCGQCKCDPGKGGRTCECDLNQHGVSTAAQLDDRCRVEPGAAICSGAGKCNCGRCECDSSSKSEFCESDDVTCPTDSDGKLCSGQGECKHGRCICEDGYTGPECDCKVDPAPCTENGLVCSGNGNCECGRCACNSGFTGEKCSVEQSSSDWNQKMTDDGDILPPDDEGQSTESPHHQHGGQTDSASCLTSVTALILASQFLRYL